MISDVFFFLLTLGILVTFHEYGHYWVAKRCGVKVLRFSVGFGKPLWKWLDKSGTEFVVAAIPLGGYVKMLDEREAEVSPELLPQSFNRQTTWRRAAIIAAGPLANFLLAILVYWCVFVIGVPGYKPVLGELDEGSPAAKAGLLAGQEIVAVDGMPIVSQSDVNMALVKRLGDSGQIVLTVHDPESARTFDQQIVIDQWLVAVDNPQIFASLGLRFWRPEIPPVIAKVVDGGAADKSGLLGGDTILSINAVQVQSWKDVSELISQRPNQLIDIAVDRAGKKITNQVAVDNYQLESGENVGRIGIVVDLPRMPASMQVIKKAGVLESLLLGVEKTGALIGFTFQSIKKMLIGLISPSNLGGPLTIAKIASASAESGLVAYLQILALLSVSLGVFNLLPIPILDGGHLLIILLQATIRKPIPEKVLMGFQQVGLFFILLVMVFALYNDFTRY